jgi:hypothetical protein
LGRGKKKKIKKGKKGKKSKKKAIENINAKKKGQIMLTTECASSLKVGG